MSEARTDADAIESVQRALHSYVEETAPALARSDSEMSRMEDTIRSRRERYAREVRELERRIAGLMDVDPQVRDVVAVEVATAELRVRQRKVEETARLAAQVQRAHETFVGQRRRFAAAIAPLADLGRRRMTAAREDVRLYEVTQPVQTPSASRWKGHVAAGVALGRRSRSAPAGVGGDGGQSSIAAGQTGSAAPSGEFSLPGVPADMTLVPVGHCDDGGRVTSPADFTNGKVAADEMVWAAAALFSDVLPRMARGGDVAQRLHDTDTGRGNVGNTSLAATHRGFFGSTRIVLVERADGSYEVTNGAHRLWAARQAGISHIPAEVRRLP